MNLKDSTQNTVQGLQSTLGKIEVALGSILDCIVWTDKQGCIQWCNGPFDHLVGHPHLTVLGNLLTHLLPLKKDGAVVEIKEHPLTLLLNGQKNIIDEYEFVKDEKELILEIYGSRIQLRSDAEESLVFTLRDVTDKRKAEENARRLLEVMAKTSIERAKALELEKAYMASLNIMADLDKEKKRLKDEIEMRQSIEHRLRQLSVAVEQSPNSIMITDTNGVVQYVNPRFGELTGYEEKEVMGTTARVMKPGQLPDENHKQLWENLRRGKAWKGEFRNKRKNGKYYWEYVVISPVYDQTEHISNFLVMMQDITRRKEAEEKMKEALEMKSEFTSTVSHELRTPLASIKGAIDIVMSKTAGPLTADQDKFLGKAKSNIDRLKRLIDDFLDLSKLESGRMSLEIQPNDMKMMVDDVLDIERPVAEKKGLRLRSELTQGMPQIPCDADKISQVFTNFISNAIKFTHEGEIVISAKVSVESNYIEFCVSDTGEGIKKEDLQYLFEKFKQFGDPAKRKTGGTGLGLAICKEIIDQHKGKIWAESELGQGSRFYFILPITERRK